jgi:hypothetical protein
VVETSRNGLGCQYNIIRCINAVNSIVPPLCQVCLAAAAAREHFAFRAIIAANFVGWEKDPALFDRELEKVIRALRTGEGGREQLPPARL